MFGIPLIEWVGYAASIMIAISLIMTNIVKLRVINSIGCILFAIYGFTNKSTKVFLSGPGQVEIMGYIQRHTYLWES